jgi:pimeloyl-ACP methyl ester carboxylesterase
MNATQPHKLKREAKKAPGPRTESPACQPIAASMRRMTMDRPFPDVLDVMTLTRPDGQLAYDVRGDGPVVICSPGAGDLRSGFTAYANRLALEGYRVVTADLRGHGGSSLGWSSYTGQQVADDLLSLADQLSAGPVILACGGSTASAAVLVAAVRPERVSALVLFNPEIISAPASRGRAMLERLAGWPRVGRLLWSRHWRQLHVRRPADLTARGRELTAILAQPGRYEAVRVMQSSSAAQIQGPEQSTAPAAALLPLVSCPVLVMMGEDDPDAAEPGLQAQTIVENLGGPARVLLVPDVGHFPPAEVPEVAASQTSAFLRSHVRL